MKKCTLHSRGRSRAETVRKRRGRIREGKRRGGGKERRERRDNILSRGGRGRRTRGSIKGRGRKGRKMREEG